MAAFFFTSSSEIGEDRRVNRCKRVKTEQNTTGEKEKPLPSV
jgi:hypothetical protein